MDKNKCHKHSNSLQNFLSRYQRNSSKNVAKSNEHGNDICTWENKTQSSYSNQEVNETNKTINCAKRRKNIFRSLRKVQSRVIFCISNQKIQSLETSTLSTHAVNTDDITLPIRNQIGQLLLQAVNTTPKFNFPVEDDIPPHISKRDLYVCPIEGSIAKRSVRVPTVEIFNLANCCWYWGPMSRQEAEQKLFLESDGSFLVRDSSSDNYLFTLSFRSVGHTFHARIEHAKGCYSLYDQEGYSSISELIDNAMLVSKESLYCYTRPRTSVEPMFPVRLTSPMSRFTQLRTLKYLCRFVIRQFTNVNNISKLPIPKSLQIYIKQGHY